MILLIRNSRKWPVQTKMSFEQTKEDNAEFYCIIEQTDRDGRVIDGIIFTVEKEELRKALSVLIDM